MKTSIWSRSTTLLLVSIVLFNLIGIDCQVDQKRATSNICKIDKDCPDNAFCKTIDGTGYCNCKVDFFLHPFNDTHRECLREADRLGDPCRIDLQCHSKLSINSECANNACQCKPNSHFDEGRCYQTALIGQKCVVTQNCYLGPDDISSNQAFCVRGICQCNLLHSPRNGGSRCLKDAILGDECEDNEHCTGENTECREVCRCTEGYVVHPNEEYCIKAAKTINDPCEIDAQCTAFLNGTTCTAQKCVCNWDHHLDSGRCWHTRNIGQRCNYNQECIAIMTDEKGQCIDGECKCIGCKSYGGSSALQPKTTFIIMSSFLLLLSVIKS